MYTSGEIETIFSIRYRSRGTVRTRRNKIFLFPSQVQFQYLKDKSGPDI